MARFFITIPKVPSYYSSYPLHDIIRDFVTLLIEIKSIQTLTPLSLLASCVDSMHEMQHRKMYGSSAICILLKGK